MTKRATTYMTSSIRLLTAMLLVSGFMLTPSSLYGQAICFPPHEGLPNTFLAPTIDGYVEPELGVPNTDAIETGWTRATRYTYMGDTFRPLMVFQAIKHNSQDFIYLSFDVRADETFDDEDVIMLVFRPTFSTVHSSDERRIDIYPVHGGADSGSGAGTGPPDDAVNKIRKNRLPAAVKLFKWDISIGTTGGWGSPMDITDPATNSNLTNYEIKVRSWAPTDSNNNWSVEVKLPIRKTSGTTPGGTNWVDLGTDFSFFFDVIRVCFDRNTTDMINQCAATETSSVGSVNGFYNVQYTWPRAAGIIADPSGETVDFNTFEVPQNWPGQAFLDNNANCRGVRFENGPIGIGIRDPANASGPLLTSIDSSANVMNTFVARLRNDGSGPANGVKATFRMANWGIIGSAAATWDPIPAQPSSGTNTNPTQGTTVPTGTTPTDLTVNWELNDFDRDQFIPNGGMRDPHQCMWVLLDSNSPVDFADTSVRRNMTFRNLSTLDEDAEVNGKGFPHPAAGNNHDFLLNISAIPLAPLTKAVKGDKVLPNIDAMNVTALEKAAYKMQAAKPGPITTYVWVADGYRAIGSTLTINNKKFSNYEPVGSYGYVASHDGPVKEFKHELTGAAIQKLGNDKYGLKVPDGGVARIHTRLEAVPGTVIPPGNAFKRWGLSLHGGLSVPHGNFNTVFNPGPNIGVDLEYRLTPTFSLEGIYTYHRFNGETFAGFTVPALNLHQFSANGKVYGSSAPVRPFFNFGGGAYVFTPGVSTHGGLNVGGGVQFDINPNLAFDAMYNYHNVFTSGSNTAFSTAQVGVRWRF